MRSPDPLDLSTLSSAPGRASVAAHRRLLRSQARASRTSGQRLALAVVSVIAVALVAVPPTALVVAATATDAERRTSAAAVAIGGTILLAVTLALAVLGRRTTPGPALLRLAQHNGLAFDAWIRRRAAGAQSLVVHVAQHDLDVLRDAEGISWGRTSIHASGGRRVRGLDAATLAYVAVPLGVRVPHLLLADERSQGPSSIVPEAVGAIELVAAGPSPWRLWTTEPQADAAAAIVDACLLATLETHAPGFDVELVGEHALLMRRVEPRWDAADPEWLTLVDDVRTGVAPMLRAAAAAQPAGAWAPLPDDEPLGRSLRLELMRRARRDALVDGVLDVASGAS